MKMAEFSHTEFGSGQDMLAATWACQESGMRRKYYLHALDELKHARLFHERAKALAEARGGRTRVEAVLEDSGYIGDHGITSSEPLYLSLPETEFLAFVYLHEESGALQFAVYADLMKDDPASTRMFDEIARDERFHISYSRAELERRRKNQQEREVNAALWAVRLRGFWQAWGRMTHTFGRFMSKLWLGVLYFVILGPFALVAKARERVSGGILASDPIGPAVLYARLSS
jgi:hypothetical protein